MRPTNPDLLSQIRNDNGILTLTDQHGHDIAQNLPQFAHNHALQLTIVDSYVSDVSS